MEKVLIIAAIVVCAYFVVNAVFSLLFITLMFRARRSTYAEREKIELACGNLSETDLKNFKSQPIFLDSKFGYKIYAEYIPNEKKTNKTVVIMHGYCANKIVSIKYQKMFTALGFNVVLFDNANCGNTGGNFATMSYREKFDLARVVEYARSVTGENARIALHGESMGAATVLRYLKEDGNIDFVIADCGFSSLRDEAKFRVKQMLGINGGLLAYFMSFWCKVVYGFYFSDVNALKDIKEGGNYDKTPIMFVHGGLDQSTPHEMSFEMYNAKKGAKKLYFEPYARHARTILYDRTRYFAELKSFIEEYQK